MSDVQVKDEVRTEEPSMLDTIKEISESSSVEVKVDIPKYSETVKSRVKINTTKWNVDTIYNDDFERLDEMNFDYGTCNIMTIVNEFKPPIRVCSQYLKLIESYIERVSRMDLKVPFYDLKVYPANASNEPDIGNIMSIQFSDKIKTMESKLQSMHKQIPSTAMRLTHTYLSECYELQITVPFYRFRVWDDKKYRSTSGPVRSISDTSIKVDNPQLLDIYRKICLKVVNRKTMFMLLNYEGQKSEAEHYKS
jgi:hypothetical protein